MTVMDDLIAFLKARLAEREAKARGAGIKVLDDDCERSVTTPESLSWEVERNGDNAYVQDADGTNVALASDVSMMDEDWEAITAGRAEHIADNDPAWVLADVDAKRRIIDDYERWAEYWASDPAAADHDYRVMNAGMDALILTLRLLALPYAGRPDYREEWKP